MKRPVFLSMVLVVLLIAAATAHASATKVLINVVQEKSGGAGSGLIKETEMLMARALLDKNFDVMTSDDLSAMDGLTKEDIEAARAGSMPELRKAAGLNDAAFIVSARAATDVHQEEVLNMQMNKAQTSVAYRVVNTATGRTIDMNSLSFTSASRSAREASHSNYQKMSGDIARIVIDKLPEKLPGQDAEKLAEYTASLTKKPAPALAEGVGTAAESETVVAQADPSRVDSESKTHDVASPGEGPELIILNPPATRGFIPVARQKDMNIEGMAIDPGGIAEVRINGEKVAHDQEGRFKHQVVLDPGENRFLIMAVNSTGKMATKDLTLERGRDTDPPELTLLRPNVTRGFQIAVKPETKNTIVEGIVKDESDILFVRVNDQDVLLSDTGHFLHELALDDSTTRISVEAADIHGNISRKALEVARGETEWALSPQNALRASAPDRKPVLWGLAIGVSKYTSSSISLRYADQDALKLEKLFKSHEGRSFSEVHFKTLVNEAVSRNSIIDAISRHLGQAAPDDIIFIFMAGHGVQHRQSGSYYFMPSDADFDNLLSTGLRMSDFEESVRILSGNVDRIIVAMDTCHAGALEVGTRNVGSGEDLARAIRAASGLFILSASKAGEVSLESDDFKLDPEFSGHGAFTYAMVQAMRGQGDYDGDGYVSLNEIFQYVSRQVPRLTSGQQHPYFRMQGTDLPLLKID